MPCLVRSAADGSIPVITLGHPLLDDYLAFVAARARTNTWLAVASDLKIFFTVVARPPAEVTAADVFAFLAAQRAPRHGARVVRLEDGAAVPARGQGRPPAGSAGLRQVLRSRRPLPGARTTRSLCDQAGVRGAQGSPARRAAVGGRAG